MELMLITNTTENFSRHKYQEIMVFAWHQNDAHKY